MLTEYIKHLRQLLARASRAMRNYLSASGTVNVPQRAFGVPAGDDSVSLGQNVAALLADVDFFPGHLFTRYLFVLYGFLKFSFLNQKLVAKLNHNAPIVY